MKGTVLITIADRDKEKNIDSAKNFRDMGFTIFSTVKPKVSGREWNRG